MCECQYNYKPGTHCNGCNLLCKPSKPPATSSGSPQDTIDRLRGQLQNCVNHLELLKRHGYASDVNKIDACIDSANRALYETLVW